MNYLSAGARELEPPHMIHQLTEIVLSIFRFPELSFQRFYTGLAILEETDAFHVGHAVTLLVIYTVGQVHLVRKQSGLG
jgi:hypothetical protein